MRRRLEPNTLWEMQADGAARGDLVVLVHGLWMTGAVGALLARRLRTCGFDPALFSYPSVRLTLDENVRHLLRFVEARGRSPVHFIGHSLGGLVVLALLARERTLPTGRVVLLGSPCSGSQAAAQLAGSRTGRALVGRTLPGWKVEQGIDVAQRLPVGAIAGTRRFGLGSVLVRLQGPNDGVVAVEETRLPGLRDHIVLPVTHSGMVVSARVARQVCSFLTHGSFQHA